MPTYCVRCEDCNLEESHVALISNRNEIKLSCGHIGRLVIKPPRLQFFRSGWYEHITSEPIHIDNKQELKEACEKHGVYSRYLQDSPVGTNVDKREI